MPRLCHSSLRAFGRTFAGASGDARSLGLRGGSSETAQEIARRWRIETAAGREDRRSMARTSFGVLSRTTTARSAQRSQLRHRASARVVRRARRMRQIARQHRENCGRPIFSTISRRIRVRCARRYRFARRAEKFGQTSVSRTRHRRSQRRDRCRDRSRAFCLSIQPGCGRPSRKALPHVQRRHHNSCTIAGPGELMRRPLAEGL